MRNSNSDGARVRAILMVESESIIPPETLDRWQSIVDVLADIIQVPAALIMRLRGDCIEVLVSSNTSGNPYTPGHSELIWNSGLYCERVLNTQARLLVNNALLDPEWCDNPDVKLRMISYLGLPIFWPDRKPFGTICVLDSRENGYNVVCERLISQFRDIVEQHLETICSTARYRANGLKDQKAPRKDIATSPEYLRVFVGDATDGLILYDDAGQIKDISKQPCQLIGRSHQQLADGCINDLRVRYENQWHSVAWKSAKNVKVATIPSACVPNIDQTKHSDIRFSCRATERHKAFLGVFHQARARFDADRISPKRLATAIDDQRIALVGTWRWNVRRDEFFGSEECARILGVKRYGSRLSYDAVIALTHPDDRRRVAEELQHAMSGLVPFRIETRVLRTKDTECIVEVAGRPIVSRNGKSGFLGTLSDVTERVHAKNTLYATQAALASALRSSAIGELAGSVVHEISQPLGVIANYAGTMRRWLDRAEPDLLEVRDAAYGLIEAAVKAGEIAARLKAIARTPSVKMSKIDLDAAIGEVLALAKHDVQLHGAVLSTNLQVRGTAVCADKARVQQVMLNMVFRAMRAMASMSGRTKKLLISSERVSEEFVRVTVEDNGVSLNNEDFERIFEPLPTARPDDMGMGLSVCRSIIEAQGGRVWVKSGSAGGTILCLELRSYAPEGQ
ncbi:PAS domain S-box protein [Paraburkholderia sp. CNPSo 3157]|uniref:histidine kinase n=1 Tax=Paraburkholderia franconis TaxID=2654983 RepID=A0A7X1NKF1_9BURK|nr:ATP-binding protein [Paraburkholderia franconis]MPW23643.1 PAS domain S-box protein [Paraburkholderia franconis]